MNPIPFGKYTLLRKIGTGGMAELFLAKQEGMEGFEKTLAIKRILPHLTQNSEFVSMFINEAKLAAILNHQNIAQIYDLGSAVPLGFTEPSYYIAMELIKGKDLRSIYQSIRNQGTILPIDHVLSIMSQICCGLDYAHRKKDTQGRKLNIVHRDISPQNILVSFEGEVKIVDFGIAKAAFSGTETRTGLLKGKVAYMSPEQAWGRPVDRRTDIFAMGIVFYEILTGERLFKGDNEIETLEKVRSAKVTPPHQFNPQIDKNLIDILLKALAKDPSDRYQTASKMALDLETVISKKGYSISSINLGNFMQHLFQSEMEKINDPAQELSTPIDQNRKTPYEDLESHIGVDYSAIEPNSSSRTLISQEKEPLSDYPATKVSPSNLQKKYPSKPFSPSLKSKKFHPLLVSFFFLAIMTTVSIHLATLYDPHLMKTATNYFPWLNQVQHYLNNIKTSLVGEKIKYIAPLPSPSEQAPLLLTNRKNKSDRLMPISLRPEASKSDLINSRKFFPPPNPQNKLSQNKIQIDKISQKDSISIISFRDRSSNKKIISDLFKEAKRAYHKDDLQTVEKNLLKIIEIAPDNPKAYHLLGSIYLKRGESETALQIFSQASGSFPDDPGLHFDLGFLFFDKNFYKLAQMELSKAISLAPESYRADQARRHLDSIGGIP